MTDESNISLSMSRLVNLKLKAWIDERKAKGDDSIPSVGNLINRLGIAFLLETTEDPDLASIEKAINKAASRVARMS